MVSIQVTMPPETLVKLDAARGTLSRSAYIRWCLRNMTGTFPPGGLSAGHRSYLMAFEQHLRSDAGIDTALDIARDLAVTIRRQNRRAA